METIITYQLTLYIVPRPKASKINNTGDIVLRRNDNWNNSKRKFEENFDIQNYVDSGRISKKDAELIQLFVIARAAKSKHMKIGQKVRITLFLITLRKHMRCDYANAIFEDYQSCTVSFRDSKTPKGEPYTQNAQHDYISTLKSFMHWLIKQKILNSNYEEVKDDIKTPSINKNTTPSTAILKDHDIKRMLEVTTNPMHRALIGLIWETGARPEECGEITWSQCRADEWGYRVLIRDYKSDELREARITDTANILSAWQHNTAFNKHGDFVFTTQRKRGISYKQAVTILETAAKKAGVEKSVWLYGLRKGRINDLKLRNEPDSAIKAQIWGNQGTTMLGTYMAPTMDELDIQMLEARGLLRHADIEEHKPALKGVECPDCHWANDSLSDYCSRCGKALSKKAIKAVVEQKRLQTQKQSEELDEWMREEFENKFNEYSKNIMVKRMVKDMEK